MDNRHEFGDCWTLNSVLLRRDEVKVKTGVMPPTREKWGPTRQASTPRRR
jgi:hypothetical protein